MQPKQDSRGEQHDFRHLQPGAKRSGHLGDIRLDDLIVILLATTLAGKVPGLPVVIASSFDINLEDEKEVVLWSGRCARLIAFPPIWRSGKLFVTNRRLVWMTHRELGLASDWPRSWQSK